MIKLIKTGRYRLIETKNNVKILSLDEKSFAWVEPKEIGELLVTTHGDFKTDCVLSVGHYNLYDVKNDSNFSDHLHLELEAGPDIWQGYLLLTGLPDDQKKRGRIIPTQETITKNRAADKSKLS